MVKNREQDAISAESAVRTRETAETTETTETASIIGGWKCEEGEVTFTESGTMMLGKDGIVLGGGWVQYEVVDDSTLYVSGGNIPMGTNIKYSLSSEYLTLELKNGSLAFTRN